MKIRMNEDYNKKFEAPDVYGFETDEEVENRYNIHKKQTMRDNERIRFERNGIMQQLKPIIDKLVSFLNTEGDNYIKYIKYGTFCSVQRDISFNEREKFAQTYNLENIRFYLIKDAFEIDVHTHNFYGNDINKMYIKKDGSILFDCDRYVREDELEKTKLNTLGCFSKYADELYDKFIDKYQKTMEKYEEAGLR